MLYIAVCYLREYMTEQPPIDKPSDEEKRWYEHSPGEMIARVLGRVSVETSEEPKIPISAKLEKWLYGEESDEWSKERLKPYAWRLMPPGMRSAKGLLNEVAYQTVEPGPVILLKQGDAKARILAKMKAQIQEEPTPQAVQQENDDTGENTQ